MFLVALPLGKTLTQLLVSDMKMIHSIKALVDDYTRDQGRISFLRFPSSTPLLDSYPRVLVPPTGDASGGVEEGNRVERSGSSRRLEK